MEWFAGYLVLGSVAGFLAGLFGVGGGLVLVPVLLMMFDGQELNVKPDTVHVVGKLSVNTVP